MKPQKVKTIFGFRLQQLMNERGMNAEELAQLIGKERKAIYSMKYSKEGPRLREVIIMAKHFGVSTDYLAGLTNIRVPVNKVVPGYNLEKKPDNQKYFNDGWGGNHGK